MNILVIKHVESEGPGTLGGFLQAHGATLHVVNLHRGESLPTELEGFKGVISMGGPMNVYEDDQYPFLANEVRLLQQAMDAQVPVLGICLGAQMIARASGGRVTQSPVKEVGWGKVSLTSEGRQDGIFQGTPGTLEVLQWHGDMFVPPSDGALLASGSDCPHQALRVGSAVGFQFHVEVDRDMIADWFADSPDLEAILSRYDEIEGQLRKEAEVIYKNFLEELKR
ncbi:MAG: type 1 glutamine amidotransferase [Thermodesulfobacteriota bacterium]